MKKLASALVGASALALLSLPVSAQEALRIGTEAAYKPFAWVLPSGELTGFDIDIANAMCAEMGVECEIINQAYDGLIPALQANKIDAIIASMFITPEREEAIAFAGPYYSVPAIFVAPKGEEVDVSPEGLRRMTVGVQRGSTMANYVEQKLPGARMQLYDTIDAASLDLSSGRIDVMFADSGPVLDFLATDEGSEFEQVGEPVYDPEILGVGAGIGLRKEEAELKEQFDAALAAVIESGEYKTINDEYLSVDIQPK